MKLKLVFSLLFVFMGILNSHSQIMRDEEKMIFKQSNEESDNIDRSDMIIGDTLVNAYLDSLLIKLAGRKQVEKFHLKARVIKNPVFNAFAYPNGRIFIHSGLFCQIDNEAQLATLLSHELTHVTNKHALKQLDNLSGKANALGVFGALTVGGGIVGGLANIAGVLGTRLSLYGYAQNLETEADTAGLRLMLSAGYSSEESLKLFSHLMEDIKFEKIQEPYFYSTHPRVKERLETYTKLLNTKYKTCTGGVTNQEQFEKTVIRILVVNTDLSIAAGRFSFGQRLSDKMVRLDSLSSWGWYFKGEVIRKKTSDPDSLRTAELYFSKSIASDSTFAPGFKQLGLISYKRKDFGKSDFYFEKYLALAPESKDKKFIESYIRKNRSSE